jgi:tetratricopeptide (TPR) repeat protein/transcriptional regulator with XRE-family HTH domain
VPGSHFDRPLFGELLRLYRGAAGLTQEELAERAGLSVQAIGGLERGLRRAPRSSTVAALATALRLTADDRAALVGTAQANDPKEAYAEQLAEALSLFTSLPTDTLPPHAPLPEGSRMPLAPNPLFVGRHDDLIQVATALKGDDATVALGHVVASTGLGGLGKTQLAVELVHRYGRFFAGGVFWLNFASAAEIPLQIAACAGSGAVGLGGDVSSRPLEERVKVVMSAWQGSWPRLLVFDNCEEESLLEAWRPTSGGCRVLVTSRRSHWSPTLQVTSLGVGTLQRSESIELLARYRSDLHGHPRVDAVAHELGDLALALHLAGSYLRTYRAEVDMEAYLLQIRQQQVVEHASQLGRGLEATPTPTHHVQSLAQTFSLSLDRLDRGVETDRVAIALLARMACMAPGTPVPIDLLRQTLDVDDPLLRVDALRRLGALGLVVEGEGSLKLHRLLAHFVRRADLDASARTVVDQVLIRSGNAAAGGDLTGVALAAVIPHIINAATTASVDAATSDDNDHLQAAQLWDAAGKALQHAGDLGAARHWYENALDIHEAIAGPDHPDTAISLNNLASLLRDQGDLAAARPLYERALEISERVLGPDHPATAIGLNNLALLLRDQGDLVAARPLYEQALEIRERVMGPDHPAAATSLNSLASLLRDQGDLAAARPLFERALEIRERVMGPDHPATATSLNSLALLLRDQGDLAAARPLFERALDIRERVLGPDHHVTAITLNNLASLLRDQGDLAAARPLFERALEVRERVLGPDHHDTATSLNNLALLLRAQGDLAAARPLFERALEIGERVLGPDHHVTAITLNNLASLLRDQGDLAAARPLFERALEIRERVLGPDHHDTATSFAQSGFRQEHPDQLPAEMATLPVRQRLLWLLSQLAQANSSDEPGRPVEVTIAQDELAAAAGASRAQVAVCLGQLRAKGIISTTRRRILVNDVAGLHQALGRLT